jgi:hypothetical protein
MRAISLAMLLKSTEDAVYSCISKVFSSVSQQFSCLLDCRTLGVWGRCEHTHLVLGTHGERKLRRRNRLAWNPYHCIAMERICMTVSQSTVSPTIPSKVSFPSTTRLRRCRSRVRTSSRVVHEPLLARGECSHIRFALGTDILIFFMTSKLSRRGNEFEANMFLNAQCRNPVT